MGAKMACFTHNFVGNKGGNVTCEKLGTICDQKSSGDRLEGQHEGQQAWCFTSTVFQPDDAPGMCSSTLSPSSTGGLLRSYPPCFNCPSKRSPEPLRL